MANPIKWAGDTLRTAPYGWGLVGVNLLTPAITLADQGFEVSDVGALGFSASSMALCGLVVATQFRLRRRLERIVQNGGFREDAFRTTTTAWCNRQTARVVCRNSGHLEEYEALCRQDRSARLTWLPDV